MLEIHDRDSKSSSSSCSSLSLAAQRLARVVSTRLTIVSVMLLALIGTGCGGNGNGNAERGRRNGAGAGPQEKAITVRVEPVRREQISSLYSTSATLRSDRRATVIARTRGVIRHLLVEEGDRVVNGQALAELENDEQRIAAARARTTAETAAREVDRQAGLLEQGLVSEDEYERSKRDADDARHALELAELELSRTVIRAPFAGIVLQRHLDVGATVSDGTAVYDLADLEPLYADINIPERHVARLRPEQRVHLNADSSNRAVPARIERIAPLVDTATGTVKVTVAVEGDAQLRPGAFVRVNIVTDTHEDALVVPRSALVAEGRRWHLYRLAEPGTLAPQQDTPAAEGAAPAERQADRGIAGGAAHTGNERTGDQPADDGTETVEQIEVRLGFENGNRVEIAGVVSKGVELGPGSPVVVAGAPALSDGASVRVIRDEPDENDSDQDPAEMSSEDEPPEGSGTGA